jgi:hypothetical protein
VIFNTIETSETMPNTGAAVIGNQLLLRIVSFLCCIGEPGQAAEKRVDRDIAYSFS